MNTRHLGPYELGEPLGKGGMGTVYRATHRDTGELAAVKALTSNLAALEGFRDRFEAEIESLKLLGHQGIVRLLGYGEEEGVLFYAMELVEGTSLEEELRAGRRFTWLEVIDYGVQICRALKHAHDHGVIHRDIKPANLLLDQEGRIKIADFGIARLFGSTQLTSAGGVLGTADYMSPEQTDGRNVTEKCDQYSLGGVMYALLAGRPPFRARSLPEMLQLQRFADPEPVRRFAPDTPPQLEKLIMQLLSKDPAARFPNILVLARHMEAMRRALSRPAPDDFALSVEASQPASIADPSYEAIAMDTTRIEPIPVAEASSGPSRERVFPAPTSRGLDFPRGITERGSDLTGPFTNRHRVDEDEDLEIESPADPTDRRGAELIRTAPEAPATTRFRTVDDDLLPPSDEGPSRLIFVAQIAGLLGAIALIAMGVWYFSRPATPDELYIQIAEVAEQGKIESLRTVEEQIDEFLTRFPESERVEEIAGYKEEIELSRLEDMLHKRAGRRLGPQSLAPIEQMYLDAIRKADYDPGDAIEDLQAILVLYGAGANDMQPEIQQEQGQSAALAERAKSAADIREFNRRVQNCMRLAERRLARLSQHRETEAKRQLPVLRRRLAAARDLEATDSARARSLYLAIIKLSQEKPWAAALVQEGKAGLERLEQGHEVESSGEP